MLPWQAAPAALLVSGTTALPKLSLITAKLVALEAKLEALEVKNVVLESASVRL